LVKIKHSLGPGLNRHACFCDHYVGALSPERGGLMELRQIKYAIAISEELTFTGAAKRCGITQPTITNAMKKLEQELGDRLFKRGRTVELTPFGSQVMTQFYRIQDVCASLHAILGPKTNPQPRRAAGIGLT
jgi:DNA-binding transcriptional LysR family regulator